MKWFKDIHNRRIRLTYERQGHIETDHPEMFGQIDKIQDTLVNPDMIGEVTGVTSSYVISGLTCSRLRKCGDCRLKKVKAESSKLVSRRHTQTHTDGKSGLPERWNNGKNGYYARIICNM